MKRALVCGAGGFIGGHPENFGLRIANCGFEGESPLHPSTLAQGLPSSEGWETPSPQITQIERNKSVKSVALSRGAAYSRCRSQTGRRIECERWQGGKQYFAREAEERRSRGAGE